LIELVIGQAASLWKPVHAAPDFDVHGSVVDERLQIVLLNDGVGQHVNRNAHVFIPLHRSTEIEILQINCHELCVFGG
jgi:hypothetical protein